LNAKAIVFEARSKVKTGEVKVPKLKENEVLVEADYTLISPGTELRVLDGKDANANRFPLVPGYSLSGRIVEKGAAVEAEVGSAVFVSNSNYFNEYNSGWGGHISHTVCDYSSGAFPVPEDVGALEASFAAVLGIACHGVHRTDVAEGDKVVIIGQGIIGQLAMQVFKAMKAKVVTADTIPLRVDLSKTYGAEHCINADERDVGEALRQIWPDGADIVVDATGVPAAARSAGKLLREKSWEKEEERNPQFLLLGSYVGDVCFDYFSFLFPKEPNIYVSRATLPSDVRGALDLLKDEKVEVKHLVSDILPFEKAELAYSKLKKDPQRYMTFAFKW